MTHSGERSIAAGATSFDYIIIGAGSAGCIVAANLAAAFPSATIALIEAGPPISPDNETVSDPTQWVLVSGIESLAWGYQSTPQAGLRDRVIPMGRAKGLGGCAIHNAMVYVRGGSLGYDSWASDLGCPGWGYRSIETYFAAVEARMHVTIAEPDPFINDLVRAGSDHGLVYNPNYNQILDEACVSPFQFVISQAGRRETTCTAFLPSVPPNLSVATGWTVERIVVDGDKNARAVVVGRAGGPQVELTAAREIVLSAGAIGSPQLLMLSGIGPRAALADLGIPVVQDSPGVGRNLQDDLFVTALFKSKQPMPPQPYGLMGAVIFANSPMNHWGLGTDIECSLAAGTMAGMGLPPELQQSYAIYPNLQLLASRGTVTLASANPYQAPVIDPSYLSAPGDLERCVAGLELAVRIGNGPAMAAWLEHQVLPAGADKLEDYVRQTAGTCYHYAGTCKMGQDPLAVVSPVDLKAIGVDRLRVIDASVIPRTVSGNTAAATMMIAEKGSAMITGRST
jgi:choline dehydrogenase